MANTFFVSDTHLNHSRILEFEPVARPFASLQEMNEALINNWNSVVRPNDVVWHLGDVMFGGELDENILRRLMGRKKLVLGNHDTPKKVRGLFNHFESVVGCWEVDSFILTHIPVHESQFGRFKANLHGHVHSKTLVDSPKHFNCSVEAINLTPISLEDVRKQLKQRGVL